MKTEPIEPQTVEQITRLVDRQAIVDVIHAYCRGVDTIDPDAVAALFTEDCTVNYGPGLGEPSRGRDVLRERLDRGLPRFAATSHHVSNIEVTFVESDGGGPAEGSSRSSAATVITYLYAWHRHPDDRPDAVLWARYHDRFVRRGEQWLIDERVLRVAGQQDFDVDWLPIGRRS